MARAKKKTLREKLDAMEAKRQCTLVLLIEARNKIRNAIEYVIASKTDD